MPQTSIDEDFLRLGVEYYIAARSAALADLLRVCGNLYHHAIEMLLKARLSQKHSLEKLKSKQFQHKLLILWNEFKSEFPTIDLDSFDNTIKSLDKLEAVRYPDEAVVSGPTYAIIWGPEPSSSLGGNDPITPKPRYSIFVGTIDRLVARILEVSSRNIVFFTRDLSKMNKYAREALTCYNPACESWFGSSLNLD